MITLTKMVLTSEAIPRVDLDFMNNTHYEEVEMVQTLGELVASYQKNTTHTADETKKISQLLDNWLQHTQAHFARENTLMQQIQFPAYPIHSNEHEQAFEKMTEVVKLWESDNDIELLADYIFNLWPNWFDEHVNSMDMMTARFAVMQGYDPQSSPQEQDLK